MYAFVSRIFLKGLSIVLPLAIATYVIIWLITTAEAAVKGLISKVLPKGYYIPGTGLLIIVGFTFLVGLLMYPWLLRSVFRQVDGALRRVPLFSTIYAPIKDLMALLGGDLNQKLGQPVMVRVLNSDIEMMGFVTRKEVDTLPRGVISEEGKDGDCVVVYVQWGFQLGGFCFVVPKKNIRPVDMTVEQGMQWALTAGLAAPKVKAEDKANR